MTIINVNSISGINSITAQGASGIEFFDSSGSSVQKVTGDGLTVGTGATISGSTNTITASTNGEERVRITSAGNVGIGSTQPERKLDVVDSGSSGAVVRSKVTTNNGGYLAYEALNSSGTSVFSVTHNGRINLSENIVFASGQGLDFSATSDAAGMTSELLDDYEKGTWTPAFVNGTSVSYSSAYTDGWYVKIGDFVLAGGVITTNSFTNTATQIQITLPFAVGNNNREYGPVNLFPETGNIYAPGEIMALLVPGTSRMQFYKMSSSSTDNYASFDYDDVEDVNYRIRWTAAYTTD